MLERRNSRDGGQPHAAPDAHSSGGGGGINSLTARVVTPRLRAGDGGHNGTPKLGTPGYRIPLQFPSNLGAAGSDSPNIGHTSIKGHKQPAGRSWWRTLTSVSLLTHARFIVLFVVLTMAYSLAFISYCRHDGACAQLASEASANALATHEAHMKLAHTPVQQLKCRPCPDCSEPTATAAVAAPCPPVIAPTPCPECAACPPAAPVVAAATAVSDPSLVSHASFTQESVLGENPIPIDSTGTVFRVHGRGASGRQHDEYTLCSFTRVCAQHNRLLFTHHDSAQVAKWKEEWGSKCWKVEHWKQPTICSCFHPNFQPEFLTEDQIRATEKDGSVAFQRRHMWAMHKWVEVHHIAHWAQKLIIWQALYQHASILPLPALAGLLFHDSSPPLSDHEQVIFDAALAALQPENFHPLAQKEGREGRLVWADTLNEHQKALETSYASQLAAGQPPEASRDHMDCFERLSFTPHYGIFSTDPSDTSRFRSAVYKLHDLPPATRCPPRRAVLIYRHNRNILNRDEIKAMVKAEFSLDLEYGTVNEESTSRDQVSLFASTGLLMSPHSSQLINVLFSPPGGAMVEIAPEFYNADFSEYAHGMGVFFQYALGGEVPGGEPQPLQTACVEQLSKCNGASHCILQTRYLCKNTHYPNKNRDYIANITAVRIAVANSLAHLNWLCGGRW